MAKVAVRFCQVSQGTPYRFDNRDSLQVYAVYACVLLIAQVLQLLYLGCC